MGLDVVLIKWQLKRVAREFLQGCKLKGKRMRKMWQGNKLNEVTNFLC
jgi:hypothetical protein